jgi:membrane protease YdiL (CAAX protease family)
VWTFGWATGPPFDPYFAAIVAVTAWSCVVALRDSDPRRGLTGAAVVVWLVLWIPFDLRWYKGLRFEPMGYEVCSLLITALAALAFAVGGRRDDLGLIPPRPRDLVPAIGIGLLFGVVAIPIGLLTGFLELGEPSMGPAKAALVGLGLVLTVALPEELFFRGVLDRELERRLHRPWVSLLISSFCFGLMHWNNRKDLGEQIVYVALATVAGMAYGLAFRKTGGLTAAVLMHALVDLVWQVFL